MTRKLKKAIDLSIIVWKELARTGVEYKSGLEEDLYSKIENLTYECPLCDLILSEEDNADSPKCIDCPLKSCYDGSSFANWCDAKGKLELDLKIKLRKKYAQEIVDTLEKYLEEKR